MRFAPGWEVAGSKPLYDRFPCFAIYFFGIKMENTSISIRLAVRLIVRFIFRNLPQKLDPFILKG